MRAGTKSLLFGVHAIWLHPFQVAYAWICLYGWTWHPLVWASFFLHDLGYWGSPNMDGTEGEDHVWFGADLLGRLSGVKTFYWWHVFSVCHSRSHARDTGKRPSALCYADKLALVQTPYWLWMTLATLSGEHWEYRLLSANGKYVDENNGDILNPRAWYESVQEFTINWIERDMGAMIHGRADFDENPAGVDYWRAYEWITRYDRTKK